MSGGSWDYAFGKVADIADALERGYALDRADRRLDLTPPQAEARHRLGRLLVLVSKALHAIEWVDSDDMSPGDEIESIAAVFTHARKAGL